MLFKYIKFNNSLPNKSIANYLLTLAYFDHITNYNKSCFSHQYLFYFAIKHDILTFDINTKHQDNRLTKYAQFTTTNAKLLITISDIINKHMLLRFYLRCYYKYGKVKADKRLE